MNNRWLQRVAPPAFFRPVDGPGFSIGGQGWLAWLALVPLFVCDAFSALAAQDSRPGVVFFAVTLYWLNLLS